MAKRTISYRDAGVDIDGNTRWVKRIQSAMGTTHGPRVINRPGAFAGLFQLNGRGRRYRDPVLVGCADGVGSKTLLGVQQNRLYGLGIDLVAMNVNDLITCGAEPLFFLDYLAVHSIRLDRLGVLIEGMADGCRQAGCALLGGETAEMPDLYERDHVDLGGFAVGVVEKGAAIGPDDVRTGDVLVGLPSSGVHANGYSLIRKLLKTRRLRPNARIADTDQTAMETLLEPTRIYVGPVMAALRGSRTAGAIRSMAHITGGGLPENVGRALHRKCDAVIDTGSWSPPAIFSAIESAGVDGNEMFRVFNMGIGFVLIVAPTGVDSVLRSLRRNGQKPVVIGHVQPGRGRVQLR
ncbi:MAG: phosphoribosylformylglycinamidine cyclo-ligase [Phycisphaerales bacterium]|nr:phosphoribosylformylglycinamidine cyclo-ligase [Phycisphaerales bacterium]